MADIKFSEFPKATISKDSDEIAILQDGVNKMIASPVLESKIINKTVSRVIDQGGASLNFVNLKGVVPTYADLDLITPIPELNDAYQVEADGLVYVYTENGFQAEGEGFVVQPEPTGMIEKGNTKAVTGDEISRRIVPIEDTLSSILIRKNYFDKSIPLIENSCVNVGGTIPAGVARISAVSGWNRIDFIYFNEPGDYTLSGISIGIDKMYAGIFNSPSDIDGVRFNTNTFTIPEGGAYVTFNVKSDVAEVDINNIQIVKGSVPAEEYNEYDEVFVQDSALSEDLRFRINESKIVDLSENRINPKDIVLNSYIAANGSIGSSANYDVTGFIPIKEGETLYCRTTTGAYSGLYDINFNPILGSFTQPVSNVVALTGTKKGVFARYSLRKTIFGRVTPESNPVYTSYTEEIPRNEKYALVNGGRPPYIWHLGNYGQSNAVYKVENHTGRYRIKFDFKLNFNINSELGLIPMVQFGNGLSLEIKTAKPILQRENAEGNLGHHYQQCVGFASGFKLGTAEITRNYPRKKPIVGLDAFSIWFKNVGGSTWEDRMDWLELYQDMCISVDAENLTFFRDGIGADGSPYNGGETSIVLQVPLKTSGVNKTLVNFYEDLRDAIDSTPLLEGVLLDFENLAEDLSTDSLLQFDKVKMVAFANYQETPPSTTRIPQYDSFPLFFPLWKDDRTHTCEIVSSSERIWISIDGETITSLLSSDLKNPIYLGGSEVESANILISNLEINRGSYGDAEVINNIIVSEMHPYILGLCGHVTHDTYYSEDGGNQSLPRLLRVIDDLKNKGYYLASMTDIVEWKLNNKTLPKRTAFIMLDDFQIDSFWTNRHVRNALLKNGAKINNCLIEDRFTPENTDRLTKSILNMRLIGWDSVIHTYLHDIRYAQKTSAQLENDISQCLTVADDTHQLSSVLVYSYGVLSTNMMKLIQYLGIQMAIDTRQIYSNGSTYEMGISREALQYVTGVSITDVFNYAL